MTKTYTFICALALSGGASAQSTALDFTANDCDGVEHTLFSELEAGNAVIIDLVMMGCQPCVTASNGIIGNVIPNTSDPSRVKFYSIGYTNSISCTQMNNWKNTNGFTHPVFAGMSAQTTYYGGMGMPTIVVLGGADHHVFYAELGYSSGDDNALITALDGALAATGIDQVTAAQVTIGPNPATDVLTITGGNWTRACVLDLQGREMLTSQLTSDKLDVSMLQAGAYVLRLTDASGAVGIARFETH